MPEPKRSLSISPLLSDDVIVRDYTKGIEGQLDGAEKAETYKAPDPDPNQKPQTPPEQKQHSEFNHNFTEPSQFSFDQEIDSASDIKGDEPPGLTLDGSSAKAFANVIGDMIKAKVPELSYNFVKVDLNSIETHILNGNIDAGLRDVFKQINAGTLEALQFSDDEIKMWKKAFKEYLEYKNIAAANPETAFYIATGVLILTQGIKITQLTKNNKQYIIDAINSYNPEYFNSFRVKSEKEAPKAQAAPAAPPQSEGQKENQSEKTKV